MDLKKAVKVWGGVSLLILLVTAFTNWSNHPSIVSFFNGNVVNVLYLLGPVLGLGWFIRSKLLGLPNPWLEQSSAIFFLAYLVPFFQPRVHSSDETQIAVWTLAFSACLGLALVLFWEKLAGWFRRNQVFNRIPAAVLLWVFALACFGVAFLKGWEGRYVLPALALAPLARFYLAKKDPEVLKAFALFLATDVLYAGFPPSRDLKGVWPAVLVVHHLLLSGLVFVYWEKLRRPGNLRAQVGLFLFALLPMVPYFYMGYGNLAWPLQIILLGMVLAWDPWLKPYGREVFLGLGSALSFAGFDERAVFAIATAVLACTVAISQLRQQLLKIPQKLFRTLALFTLAGLFYSWYDRIGGATVVKGPFLLAGHLGLSALLALFWEKLREGKDRSLLIVVSLYILLPLPVALFHGSWLWLGQAVVMAAAWLLTPAAEPLSKGAGKRTQGPASKGRFPGLQHFVEKLSPLLLVLERSSVAAWKKFLRWGLSPKVLRGGTWALGTAAVLFLGSVLFHLLTTRVVTMTPRGLLASPDTVIRAKFSEEVMATGALENAFKIEPPLAGSVRLEDSNTLVFVPSAPLKPATTYQVQVRPSNLKSKKLLVRGAKTSFSTEAMKVVSHRLFYNFDLVKGTEKELMGELEFNYPVELEQLRRHILVSRGKTPLAVELEQGSLPTRFFFRAGGLTREREEQVLTVALSGDLTCQGCDKPLGKKFETVISLPAKPKLTVEGINLFHAPGTSLISILFTLPCSSTQVRNNVAIEPAVPFTVDTEYCYAVLKAEFLPNTDYKIKVGKGLRAISGEALENPREQVLRLEDVRPYVRFADPGRFLSLEGSKMVAVKTMNLDTFRVSVEKVFRNNITSFLRNRSFYSDSEYGSTYGTATDVWSGTVTVKGGQINQEVETALDLSKWHKAPYKGLFVVTLSGENDGGRDSRSFLCTDIGLMMKRSGDDLWVQALSISRLTPLPGVKLQLVSNNNQVIQERETDAEGRAWFRNWRNNPYNFQPSVVTAQKDDDWSYLRFDQSPLDQARFDTSGDPFLSQGWDSFLTSERGLYRPGEDAYFTAVVRQADLSIPADLPVNLIIRDADWNQLAKLTTTLQSFGLVTFKYPIRSDSPTGTLTAELGLENGVRLGSTTFKVEEFIPDKIKVEVKPAKRTTNLDENLSYKVHARQLFGAPGADLKARSWIRLEAKEFIHKRWKGYRFSDPTRPFTGEKLKAPDGTTDGAGNFDVQLQLPHSLLPPSMLKAVVYAEVYDTGGRPVGANAVIDVHRYPHYLGLKSAKGREVGTSSPVRIHYAAVSPEGEPVTVKKVMRLVKRKVWYSIFKRSGWRGDGGYESGYYEQAIMADEVDVNGTGSFSFTPDRPGEYTVFLGDEGSMRSSLKVVATGPGSGAGDNLPANLEDPGKLSMSLSKAVYLPGEVPRLEVRAPFSGRLILSLEREKVFSNQSLPVAAGLNVVDLPAVEGAFLPNVYVVGLLVRAPDEAHRQLPMASFGVIPLPVDCSNNEIAFKWEAQEAVKSRQGIGVTVDTGAPGSKVVLSAVDEGILQIISFTTPDPFKHFYRKRGLSTFTASLFQEILPDLFRKEAVGGDEGEGFVGRHLNPIAAKRVKSFSQYSGILTAGPDGKVSHHFATDKFHGEVRVMAFGVDRARFGGSAFRVKVADPVVVEPSFPRFLAPGDKFDVPVLVFNNTKAPVKVDLSLSGSGPVAVEGNPKMTVSLPASGQKQVLFHGKAVQDAGVAVFKVKALDAAGGDYEVETELAVRPGNPLTTKIQFGELGPKSATSLAIPGGFIKEGQRVRLAVSSSPLLTYLGSLDRLIGYPYGCTEQVTSQAFPMLYFKDMGLLTGRFSGRANAVEAFVQDAVGILEKQQRSDGGFTLWAGGQESLDYLSNYVSHFLIEAQKQGYKVSPEVLSRLQNRLGLIQVRGTQVGRLDRRKQNVELVDSPYLLYLKVLAGNPDLESMAAMKAAIKDRAVQDRCLLSLAYSAQGDRATALTLLPPKYLPSVLQRQLAGDWFSPNKEMALYLLALTGADPQSKEIPGLLIEFGKRIKTLGHFGTTHEDAWCFMAVARAVKATAESRVLAGNWALKGGPAVPFTGETSVVKDLKLSGQEVELKNTGTDPAYYHLMVEGTQLASKKENVSKGLSVAREYRDEKGNPVNLGSVTQGQLVVVTLRIKCSKPLDNLVVVDLLPAGFEVDNPRLASRGKLGFDPPRNFSPAAMDFRDDRVLLFSEEVGGEQAFSYSVRAVTPGSFQVPGLLAEAMYDPEIYARHNTGETLVVAPVQR